MHTTLKSNIFRPVMPVLLTAAILASLPGTVAPVSAQASPFNLIIAAENGAVMLDPATGPYEPGSIVKLTAVPDDGYHFINWSGSENIAYPEAAETTIIMLEDTTVTANFEINTYILTVEAEHGRISRDPDQDTYDHGAVVILEPVPDDGYQFVEWAGDASGSDIPLQIFMDSDKTVTADFSGTCILEISAGIGGIVTAPASPYIADYMEEVNLTAIASPGYHFLNWTGDDNIMDATAATTVVIMDNDKTIKANFIKYNEDLINYGYTSFGQYQVLDTALPVSSFEDWNQLRGSFEADGDVYRTDPTTTPNFSLAVPGVPVDGQGYVYQVEFRRLGEIDSEGYTILYFNEKHHGSQVESLCLFISQTGETQLVSFEDNVTGPVLASTSIAKDNDWHTASIVNYGNMIEVYIDGQLNLVYKGDLKVYSRSGSIGVGSEGFHSEFRNIKVTELDYWLVSHLDIRKRFFYEPEPVDISFLVDSADYPLDATLKVTAPDLREYSYHIFLPPLSQQAFHLEYPADFNGADLSEKGRYKISMVTPAGEIVIPDATFEYKDEPLLSFVVGTDTHVLPNQKYSKPFTSFVASINDQAYFPTPDLVVLTGDNADDVRGLYKFKDIFDTLHVPHYAIVAGHDQLWEQPGSRGQTYYELFGDTYCFAIEREGYLFILTGAECDYNALTQGLGESLSNPSMLNWLDSVLQENEGKAAFVFHHQSPAQTRDDGYANYFWMGHGNGLVVRNLLESHGNVLAYFSGHDHVIGTKIINGIAYVGTGAVFNLPSAYRYIEVYSDQVAVHTIKFDIGQEKWFEYWYPGYDSNHTPDNYVYGSPAERDFKINTSTRILTTAVTGSGTVTPEAGIHTYITGLSAKITAEPAPGWMFSGWSGDASGTANPLTVNMNTNKNITANFTVRTYTLTTSVSGSGSVARVPDRADYGYEDTVRLTAFPDPGWNFIGWSGDLTGSLNPANIVMDRDKTITAVFAYNQYLLTVNTTGQGTVTRDPDQDLFDQGEMVRLTATPAPGWTFNGWSGDANGKANPLTVNMNTHKNITANFTVRTYTLTTSVSGSGSVARVPDRADYDYQDTVQLTAVPDPGWNFIGWSGDVVSSDNPVSVLMDSDRTITATFEPNTYTLTVPDSDHGSVTIDLVQETYTHGTIVRLTAVPDAGYRLVRWGGDASGSSNPLNVVMNSNKTIIAIFDTASSGGSSDSSSSGGGGGSSAVTVRLTGWDSATALKTGSSGTRTAAQLKSADGKLTLELNKGTKITRNVRELVSALTLETLTNIPAPPANNAIVLAYSFGPDGATFDPAVRLSFSYDPASLPEGMSEEDLYIAYWDGTQWQVMDSQVNTQTRTVTASINHFSVYGLLGEVTPTQVPTPPATPTQPASPLPTSSPTASPSPTTAVPTQASPTAPSTTTPAADKPASPFNWWLFGSLIVAAVAIGIMLFIYINKKRRQAL